MLDLGIICVLDCLCCFSEIIFILSFLLWMTFASCFLRILLLGTETGATSSLSCTMISWDLQQKSLTCPLCSYEFVIMFLGCPGKTEALSLYKKAGLRQEPNTLVCFFLKFDWILLMVGRQNIHTHFRVSHLIFLKLLSPWAKGS